MKRTMCEKLLLQENDEFEGTGGRSEENDEFGFRPAFFDAQTDTVYPSCFSDGSPAPFHLIDGLPDEVVIYRSPTGRVVAVKASVISGFVLNGHFYTREAAAQLIHSVYQLH